MCGRFASFTVAEALAADAAALPDVGDVEVRARAPRRFNVAPTQPVQMIARRAPVDELLLDDAEGAADGPGNVLLGARWGLIPGWAREMPATPLFNARGETVAEKPSFRDAYRRTRCLIPLDGWYEWRDKAPHYVSCGRPLYMAGLWTAWRGQFTATIVTTAAVGHLKDLHHRMPRRLVGEEAAAWLDGGPDDVAALCLPPAEGAIADLTVHPVGRAVGAVRNDSPDLIERTGPAFGPAAG